MPSAKSTDSHASGALTFAILAGGAASRLGGRDKGLEPLGGRPMIEWAIAYCRRVAARSHETSPRSNPEILILANRHIDEYSRYAPVQSDIVAGFQGPLAGIAAALTSSATPLVLTLPVDCPAPPDDLVERLAAAMASKRAPIVVAHDGERRQPLFAMYRRDLAKSAADAAVLGHGVWQWQDASAAIEVDFADRRRQFHNLNTPDDFASYADVIEPHG